MALKTVITKRTEGAYIVTLEGRLDGDTYTQFDEKIKPILSPETKVLILDMKNLRYVSSAGLSVIFAAKKVLQAQESVFLMTNLQPQIKKVFEIVKGLDKEAILPNMRDVDEYLDAMQKREIENPKNESPEDEAL